MMTTSSNVSAAPMRLSSTGLRSFAHYINSRFPLHTQGLAIAVSYVCSFLLYGAAAGEQHVDAFAVRGFATVALLFFAFRLVDDFDDCRRECVLKGESLEPHRGELRAMAVGYGIVVVSVIVLNWGHLAALAVALGAVLIMPITSFAVKPFLSGFKVTPDPTCNSLPRDLFLGVLYEGVIAVIMGYVAIVWSDGSAVALTPWTVVAVVGTFWVGYEIWKFSRYATRPRWRLYGLSWPEARVYLITLAIAGMAAQTRVVSVAHLSSLVVLPLGAVAVVFVGWLAVVTPIDAKDDPPFTHFMGGLLYVAAVDILLLAAVIPVALG